MITMSKYFLIVFFIFVQLILAGQEEYLQVESAIVIAENVNPRLFGFPNLMSLIIHMIEFCNP